MAHKKNNQQEEEDICSLCSPLRIDGSIDEALRNVILTVLASYITGKKDTCFIMDIEKRKILYRTSTLSSLNEFTEADIQRPCKVVYWSLIHKDVAGSLLKVKDSYIKDSAFFFRPHREPHVISADYPIIVNKKESYINQKFIPLVVNSKGEIRIGAFQFSPSSRKKTECLIIMDSGKTYEYDLATGTLRNETHKIRLSEIEQKILLRARKGQTSTEIATALCKSVNTVKTHKKNIFKKLGVKSITEAISIAESHHLV